MEALSWFLKESSCEKLRRNTGLNQLVGREVKKVGQLALGGLKVRVSRLRKTEERN